MLTRFALVYLLSCFLFEGGILESLTPVLALFMICDSFSFPYHFFPLRGNNLWCFESLFSFAFSILLSLHNIAACNFWARLSGNLTLPLGGNLTLPHGGNFTSCLV